MSLSLKIDCFVLLVVECIDFFKCESPIDAHLKLDSATAIQLILVRSNCTVGVFIIVVPSATVQAVEWL